MGEAFRAGAGRLAPVALVAAASAIAVAIGGALLLLPGLFLACALAVAVPAAVVERRGVVGAPAVAFHALRENAHRSRWSSEHDQAHAPRAGDRLVEAATASAAGAAPGRGPPGRGRSR